MINGHLTWQATSNAGIPCFGKTSSAKRFLQASQLLLADSSKYGSWSLFCAAPLDELTDVVTDSGLEDAVCRTLRERGIALALTA